MISKSYTVVVEDLPAFVECADKGSGVTCAMIFRTGLCSNIRYGKFAAAHVLMPHNLPKRLRIFVENYFPLAYQYI
uniref:Uncharacterized protein n=1 Tax=Ditylenchus dipsaci TaxID=166011 RepID=A0A915DWZ4_9BILA